jgi:hypothetical protein
MSVRRRSLNLEHGRADPGRPGYDPPAEACRRLPGGGILIAVGVLVADSGGLCTLSVLDTVSRTMGWGRSSAGWLGIIGSRPARSC